ncbi:MAG: hypothetical protein K6E85_14435 [Lachnospiraceae bacterium]|nr:hypothetical protein [Lachnospiraceae bacterium]
MEFGWINLFGAAIVILMLIPNIIYAVRNKDEKKLCTDRLMNIIEQVGRYACIVLMWLPLLVWKFGFGSVEAFLIYMIGNGVLLAAYWIVYAFYLRRKRAGLALSLAIIPACIFLMSGVLLRHWLLVLFTVIFAFGHIYVTWVNCSKNI